MTRHLLLTLLLPTLALGAETIVKKRIEAQNRLVPLKKLTVGPDDQYHGSVDTTGATLVFTRKSELVPHLCAQDVKSGEVRDFLPLEADSQEAAIGPDNTVAFTYYKFSARGDICYRALAEKDPAKLTCLKGDGSEHDAAFWRASRELGYVTRNPKTLTSQIIAENLDTGKKSVLAEGRIFSPAMHPGGRLLVYNDLGGPDGQTRVLVLKELDSGKSHRLQFQLPGISGFPAVSDDEKYIFFSHYLNDSNNDNIIDGNDNSVIFRAPVAELLKGGVVFPEQLTSAENNCSFPRPHGERVYVTCAFDGSLDIYEIPETGIVPAKWEEPLMWNSHKSSRTYQERILLLNTLKYRLGTKAQLDIDERLLSDHVLANDVSAAKFYIAGLAAKSTAEKRAFFEILGIYLDGLQLKKTQPSEEVTRQFEKQILLIDVRVEHVKGGERFKKIARALLRTFIDQPQAAAGFLKGLKFDTGGESMERHLFFVTSKWTLPRVGRLEGLTDVYQMMMTADELTDQSRIYYGFNWLQYLQDQKKTITDRLAAIDAMVPRVTDPVVRLLKSEQITLRMIAEKDQKAKDKLYPDLDKIISGSRDDYFLRKALYIRSILNFADAADFKYQTYIASNWIRYTQMEDTEFQYAREVTIGASLDRAYDTYAMKNYPVAQGYFYGSLSATDDLESHWGYVEATVKNGERKDLERTYTNLVNRQFIDDNMKFVNALIGLIDGKGNDDSIDAAIPLLRAMETDRDSPVRHLVLGYCYLQKLLRTANGYDFNRGYFDDAHRSLMLAYDIGRDNTRVKASALINLGILHQRVQNHGLAVKFLAKRKDLGFPTPEERQAFAWIYARSLFYAHQSDRAAEEITDEQWPTPFGERRAFYLQNAGNFRAAAAAYEKVLPKLTGDLNLTKANLAYGYALMKLRREDEAKKALRASLGHAERLQKLKEGGERVIEFNPARQKLVAYGLLARLGTPGERLAAAKTRGALLKDNPGLWDDQASLVLQNKVQIAELTSGTEAAAAMNEALAIADGLADTLGYLSNAVYMTTVDYLVMGAKNPGLGDRARVKKLADGCIKAYDAQKTPQPVFEEHKARLTRLLAKYDGTASK